MSVILPGGTIGILGGGQLGRMLAMEARRMGYRVGVLDPVENCPAAQVADFSVLSELTNTQSLVEFANQVDVVTIETELVPWKLLAEIETMKTTRPSSFALALVQDRLVQRQFLRDHSFPQTPFASVKDRSNLSDAADRVGFPAILKTRRSGYDGKGQMRVTSMDYLNEAWRALGKIPAILEAVAPFKMELSVVLARSLHGEIQLFPLAENVHRRNILHTTRVPAQVSDTVYCSAKALAISLANVLDYCGVMAVELFLLENDRFLINEIAPRPHNSGHFTLGACAINQFEQHLRAVCGLPLGDPSLLCHVVMGNLLGDLWRNGPPRWDRLLAHPQVRLHLYGKNEARPERKMGHFLFLGEDGDHALSKVEAIIQELPHENHSEDILTTEGKTVNDSPTPPSQLKVQV